MLSTAGLRKTGRLLSRLMWVPLIGVFTGMISMTGSSYAWFELPPLTRYSLLAVGFFIALSMLLWLASKLMDSLGHRSVLQHGLPAEAIILMVEPTGRTVDNYYHVISVLLDVQPLKEPPFQARAERLVPMYLMMAYQIGSVIEVKFNPDARSVVIPDPWPLGA